MDDDWDHYTGSDADHWRAECESLRARLAEAKRAESEALEAAARICDGLDDTGWPGSAHDGVRIAAARIRLLTEHGR